MHRVLVDRAAIPVVLSLASTTHVGDCDVIVRIAVAKCRGYPVDTADDVGSSAVPVSVENPYGPDPRTRSYPHDTLAVVEGSNHTGYEGSMAAKVVDVEGLLAGSILPGDDVQVGMADVDASIEDRDIDVDRAAAVTGFRAAAVAVDAVDSRRKALHRGGEVRGVADREREHLAVLGDEAHAAVGFVGRERGGREAGCVA